MIVCKDEDQEKTGNLLNCELFSKRNLACCGNYYCHHSGKRISCCSKLEICRVCQRSYNSDYLSSLMPICHLNQTFLQTYNKELGVKFCKQGQTTYDIEIDVIVNYKADWWALGIMLYEMRTTQFLKKIR